MGGFHVWPPKGEGASFVKAGLASFYTSLLSFSDDEWVRVLHLRNGDGTTDRTRHRFVIFRTNRSLTCVSP
jgi:hypothetical protein